MQTEIHASYRFVSTGNDYSHSSNNPSINLSNNSSNNSSNNPGNNNNSSSCIESPTRAVGASAIAECLGVGVLHCSEVAITPYVDGRIDSFEQATIHRHDEALAVLPDMVREASNRGECTVIVDCRAYYRNFAYPQLNYPSPYEVLRVVAAIEAQGLTAILEPVKQGRGKCEENPHSTLYELKARF